MGGSTVTSKKSKSNIFLKFFFLTSPASFCGHSIKNISKNIDFSLLRQTVSQIAISLHFSAHCAALCVIFMILVSHEFVKKCVLGGCTITSKTKINIF